MTWRRFFSFGGGEESEGVQRERGKGEWCDSRRNEADQSCF